MKNLSISSSFIILSIAFSVVRSALGQLRIAGGRESTEGDFPYFVNLNGCGGTLIAPDVVLTAAHCGNFTNKQVVIGAFKSDAVTKHAEVRFCDTWVPHPRFGLDGSTVNNDFALCNLDRPVLVDESRFKLVVNEDRTKPEVAENLIVMGMGLFAEDLEGSGFLHNATVPVISNVECNSMYPGLITDSMLCAGFRAGGSDSCGGDSGGPIVKRVYQGDGTFLDYHIGVISWGDGCGDANKPGVYARTSAAVEKFIRDTICGDFDSKSSLCGNGIVNPTALFDCADDESEIEVAVETDEYAGETQWSIRRKNGETILSRQYFINNYKTNHRVCLKKNSCYSFEITDYHGDGLCAENNCREYQLKMRNEDQRFAFGGNFAFRESHTFCINEHGLSVRDLSKPTPRPTPRPTSRPTNQPTVKIGISPNERKRECKNPEKGRKRFKIRGEIRKGFVTCRGISELNLRTKRQQCRKTSTRGTKKVHQVCPQACGDVGLGRCKFLARQRKEGNN